MTDSAHQQSQGIGILGGTFDPIHNAHIACAFDVLKTFDLKMVKLIPCAIPPHREQPIRTTEQRCDMVKLAIAEYPQLKLDDRECARNEPSFTIDTLKTLRTEVGESQSLIFILGTDAFANIKTWHRYQELLNFCHLVVLQRPGYQHSISDFFTNKKTESIEEIQQSPCGKIYFLEGPLMDLSASSIRKNFDITNSTNITESIKVISQSLAPEVKEYIHQNGLYQETGD
jgi:nicotinate-nucleotide adenylyltransferase